MQRSTPFLSVLLLIVTSASLPAADKQSDFFFRKGDRIVFLGDSITEQYDYSTLIELYLTTRFPNGDMIFLNAGISGDTATGGARRFAEHVLAEKPTAVTIDFGMNDGGYGGFNEGRANQYRNKTEEMLKAAKEAGVRVALISPNAVQIRNHANLKTYLETQKRFYAPLKDLAEMYHLSFVDQYAVTRKALEKIEADGGKADPFHDGVHTSGPGGLLMAHTILVGLKAPAVVSDVEIDIATKKAKPVDCTVEDLNVSSEGVSFQRKDKALPMPIKSAWGSLLPYINNLRDLNYYGLKVKGFKGGKYALSIDEQKVGEYTAEQLSEGVNLGTLTSGAVYEQGKQVFDRINAKNNFVHNRFRGIIMYDPPAWFSAKMKEDVKERISVVRQEQLPKIRTMQEEIYKKVQPTAHLFELKALK